MNANEQDYKAVAGLNKLLTFKNIIMIEWNADKENNTLEGWVNGKMIFDIKIKKDFVILYQLKKPVGNMIEFPTIELAKNYCEKIIEN